MPLPDVVPVDKLRPRLGGALELLVDLAVADVREERHEAVHALGDVDARGDTHVGDPGNADVLAATLGVGEEADDGPPLGDLAGAGAGLVAVEPDAHAVAVGAVAAPLAAKLDDGADGDFGPGAVVVVVEAGRVRGGKAPVGVYVGLLDVLRETVGL